MKFDSLRGPFWVSFAQVIKKFYEALFPDQQVEPAAILSTRTPSTGKKTVLVQQ
jgi:hypothetical protein